jgi:hypothetical protein
VAISRGVPRWPLPYEYRTLRMLAPSREVFAIEDAEAFEQAYRKQLDDLGAEEITSGLSRLSDEHGGTPLVLLCWERLERGEYCHRRAFASWYEEQTGIEIPELVAGVIEEKVTNQGRLF